MNILMVTTFYPPHIGGIEYHVENLSRQLVKRGHKVTVLTSLLPKIKLPLNEKGNDGVDVIRLKTFFPSGGLYSSLKSQGIALGVTKTIKQLVKEKRIHVIHAHGHHYFLTWRAVDIAKRLMIPSVLTMHGLYALNPSDPLAQIEEELFNRTIFRVELNKASAIIGLTPRIADYAKKYGSPSKNYFTIPNGVNHEVFSVNRKNRFRYREKYSISDDKIVVLFRGRFATIKGVRELAEAAKMIVKDNNSVFFLFVGNGPLVGELTHTLQSMKKNSRIIPWTPSNEVHELYIASDIFVLPSKSEALPLTILEAMAANLKIIATPVGGIPEVLATYPRKTYIRQPVPAEISNAIFGAINQGLGGSLKSEFNTPNHLKPFSWAKIACQVEKVYQSLPVTENSDADVISVPKVF